MVESTQELKLTDKETQIFTTLKEFMNETGLKTTLRVAGGWVRDKILGLESDDIDLALDDMFGEDFATKMCDWLNNKAKKEGEEVKK
jgi:tRNA nucleotidyltransferase/poly(A) polymerase